MPRSKAAFGKFQYLDITIKSGNNSGSIQYTCISMIHIYMYVMFFSMYVNYAQTHMHTHTYVYIYIYVYIHNTDTVSLHSPWLLKIIDTKKSMF